MKRKSTALALAIALGAGHLAAAMSRPRTTSSGTGVWDSGLYQYDALGNITRIGADQYAYDSAQRLVSGTADVQRTNVMSEQHYGYDSFGNRIVAARSTGSKACVNNAPCELTATISPATNHITSDGATYDAAGNLTVHAEAHYVYDSLNMSVRETERSNDFQFVYTPDDERVGVQKNGTWTWTVRGVDKQVLRNFTSSNPSSGTPGTQGRAWKGDYVSRDAAPLASITPTATTHFHVDHLGTPRLLTDQNGLLVSVHAYYPYGAELDLPPREHPEESRKFTGHERDVTGDVYALDYMHARYYSATAARFLAIDPGRNWNPKQPQSWNSYAYVGSNPINKTDPTGKWTKAIHEKLIDLAFPGLSSAERYLLKNASARVDDLVTGQFPRTAYQHSMRASGETVEEATKKSAAFYDKKIAQARAQNADAQAHEGDGTGRSEAMKMASLQSIGEAMHMVADASSPEHEGYQVWSLTDPAGIISHVTGETEIEPETQDLVVLQLRVIYATVYGDEGLKRATECDK